MKPGMESGPVALKGFSPLRGLCNLYSGYLNGRYTW